MLTHGPVWRVMAATMIPAIALMLVLPPAVSPKQPASGLVASASLASPKGAHRPAIVNHNLASLEFDFQPAGALPTLDVAAEAAGSPGGVPAFDAARPTAAMTIEALNAAPPTYELFTAARPADALSLDTVDAGRWRSTNAGDTGWADGTNRGVVPVPFLKWHTDQRSAFSIGISHQSYGEDTDVGVMGMWSIDF